MDKQRHFKPTPENEKIYSSEWLYAAISDAWARGDTRLERMYVELRQVALKREQKEYDEWAAPIIRANRERLTEKREASLSE